MYQNDGYHIRNFYLQVLEDEVTTLKNDIDNMVKIAIELQFKIEQVWEIAILKKLVKGSL